MPRNNPSPPPLRFLSPLDKATRQIGLHLEGEMKARQLRNVDGHMLAYLWSYGPCQVSSLAQVFRRRGSTLTSILDRLEQRGLIARELNPRDRRSFLVHLTAAGQRCATEVRDLLERFEAEIASRISDRDLEGFRAVMRAIEEVSRQNNKEKK